LINYTSKNDFFCTLLLLLFANAAVHFELDESKIIKNVLKETNAAVHFELDESEIIKNVLK